MPDTVRRLQRDILNHYAADVGLDPDPHYLGGAPLRPLPPLDTAVGGLMILGAYPSARFASVGGKRDVPVGDNLGPFEPERYFDGDRVRTQKSADELKELFLKPWNVSRNKCWVTDLVKVFLFKPGHRAKYTDFGATTPAGYDREAFEALAQRSIPWLAREVQVAKPKLMLTLGAEVAGILRGVKGQRGRNALLGPDVTTLSLDGVEVPTVHLAHPGILMRGASERNPWPARTREHVEALKVTMAAIGVTGG